MILIEITVENYKGEKTYIAPSQDFFLLNIDGLTPPNATLNTSILAFGDGARINSSRVEAREILITLKPRMPMELNRKKLYRYFQIKKSVRLFFKTSYSDVYIDGIVKSVEADLFSKNQKVVISIFCENPYFKGIKENRIIMAQADGLFEFPFSIQESGKEFSVVDSIQTVNVINNGDVENGIQIELEANGQVINPIIYEKFSKCAMSFNITLEEAEVLLINTKQNEKNVFLKKNAEKINVIDTLNDGSGWFTLLTGDNLFSYSAESGAENLTVTLIHNDYYGGI